jgi:hypothetical protein
VAVSENDPYNMYKSVEKLINEFEYEGTPNIHILYTELSVWQAVLSNIYFFLRL